MLKPPFQTDITMQLGILRDALRQRESHFGNTYDDDGGISGYREKKAIEDAADYLDRALSCLESV